VPIGKTGGRIFLIGKPIKQGAANIAEPMGEELQQARRNAANHSQRFAYS
jgi:hypothetical protein